MKNRRNFYADGKAIIGMGLCLVDWWKEPYSLAELRHDFGMQALINGVQFALDNGEDVPRRILIIVGKETA